MLRSTITVRLLPAFNHVSRLKMMEVEKGFSTCPFRLKNAVEIKTRKCIYFSNIQSSFKFCNYDKMLYQPHISLNLWKKFF